MRNLLMFFLFFLPSLAFTQNYIKDTIYGNVKSVREKMIMLDSIPEKIDPDFPDFSDEYTCDSCYPGREFLLWRINFYWYNSPYRTYGNYLREFNKNKQITKETWFYKNGTIYENYEFTYNNKSKLIEEKQTDNKGNVETIRRWGYNYAGKLASKLKVHDADIGYVFENFEYNEDGNLIEEGFFNNEEKSLIQHHEYRKNKLIKTYFSTQYRYECNPQTGRLERKDHPDENLAYEYEYDEKNNLIKKSSYVGQINGEYLGTYIIRYQYDGNNNLLGKYENGSLRSMRKYQYNTKNQLIKEEHFVKDSLISKTEYFYKNGNLIKLVENEDHKKVVSELEYKFDSQNNWTEQVKIIDGKRLFIRRRNIIYY